jgi:hypothetical protein
VKTTEIEKAVENAQPVNPSSDDPVANGTPDGACECVSRLKPGHRVADVGCFGWKLQNECLARMIHLTGFDQFEPPGRIGETGFQHIRNGKLDSPGQMYHLVIASHVLEHTQDCMGMMAEIARIMVPGGMVWIESPSELSCNIPASDDPTCHDFTSFWDDPTHVRPHTPGSLYRLAISTQLVPMQIGRSVTGGIPCVRMVAKKPYFVAKPRTRYVSLQGVKKGVLNAYNAIWPEHAGRL